MNGQLLTTMHSSRRKQLVALPISKLRSMHKQLGDLISELESGPLRDVDIASSHGGGQELVASQVDISGDPNGAAWQEVLRLYCSKDRCLRCPHGDFIFRFRRSRKGVVNVKYVGQRVFSAETIERMRRHAKAPMAIYKVDVGERVKTQQPPNLGLQPSAVRESMSPPRLKPRR